MALLIKLRQTLLTQSHWRWLCSDC